MDVFSFPGIPLLQFLITCSMQIQAVGGGEGLGTRLVYICTCDSLAFISLLSGLHKLFVWHLTACALASLFLPLYHQLVQIDASYKVWTGRS